MGLASLHVLSEVALKMSVPWIPWSIDPGKWQPIGSRYLLRMVLEVKVFSENLFLGPKDILRMVNDLPLTWANPTDSHRDPSTKSDEKVLSDRKKRPGATSDRVCVLGSQMGGPSEKAVLNELDFWKILSQEKDIPQKIHPKARKK